jgi:hypothetical protein
LKTSSAGAPRWRREPADSVAPDPEQAGTKDAYGPPGFSEPRLLMWAVSLEAPDPAAVGMVQNPPWPPMAASVAPGAEPRPPRPRDPE